MHSWIEVSHRRSAGRRFVATAGLACLLLSATALAQFPPADLPVYLEGLAPVAALGNSRDGKAALATNLRVTVGINDGSAAQATLLPFAQQRAQAINDAFINFSNLSELADGLGTTLGAAFKARNRYVNRAWQPKQANYTNADAPFVGVNAYAMRKLAVYMYVSKYFFGNGTLDKKHKKYGDIYKRLDAKPDVFGRAYGLPSGSTGANPYGNSRPYQTIPGIERFAAPGHFGEPSGSYVETHGPGSDLGESPSYPSGHTSTAWAGAIVLGVMVPERYSQIVVRAAEYSNSRVMIGAHYTMDVIGGRTMALYAMAQLLGNESGYMGATVDSTFLGGPLPEPVTIDNFRQAVADAAVPLRQQLEQACGDSIAHCAVADHGRFGDPMRNTAFFASTQTYDQPVVHPDQARHRIDFNRLAPNAGYLLTAAYPHLKLKEANRILGLTQGPGGRFLDNGSRFGAYSRINLHAAIGLARSILAERAENAPATTP